MTNAESKQAAIRKAWSKFDAKFMEHADQNGWVLDRQVEYEQKVGFQFGNLYTEDLRYRPEQLRGIENNNGWVRIDGPYRLPKSEGKYTVLGKSGKVETWPFVNMQHCIDFWLEYFTHWRPVVELPKPIY